ncbi:MAG: bifunctional hydroxymethylpyrimidine kinase/phosphomethylpyrimidine kinase [Actinomycetota bacterium]|nr:bifunctional hydroxymethylpyrimidine kinase/phosphomethylpyrimidine kinase [Actinomycetota bacterium]
MADVAETIAPEPRTIPRALTIAGSDSGGGAGIQADLNTFGAFGVFGMTAITAVTVQNTLGVSGFEELSPQAVADQIRAVVEDIGVDAAKTGMLASAPIVTAVADAVAAGGIPALVVDPVSVSKHGHRLLAEDAVATLRERILPLAALVTPNLPEAAVLAGFAVEVPDDMLRAGERLLELGAVAALVKGGHLEGAGADDLFVDATRREWLRGERLPTRNTHGTGCVLSASIAAGLARGDGLLDAVRAGKEFVTEAIRHALAIGGGIGPVDPLWRTRGGRPS